MTQMDESRWASKRVEGSVTVAELRDDYTSNSRTRFEALAIEELFANQEKVVAVLLADEAGMVYEITR